MDTAAGEWLVFLAPGAIFLWLTARAAGVALAELRAPTIALAVLACPVVGRGVSVAGHLFDRSDAWGQTVGIYDTPTSAEWARWGGCADCSRVDLKAAGGEIRPRVGRCQDHTYVNTRKTSYRLLYGQATPARTRSVALADAVVAANREAAALGGAYMATLLGGVALLVGGAWSRSLRRAGEGFAAVGFAMLLGLGHGKARIDERALQEVSAELDTPRGPEAKAPRKATVKGKVKPKASSKSKSKGAVDPRRPTGGKSKTRT